MKIKINNDIKLEGSKDWGDERVKVGESVIIKKEKEKSKH